MAKKQKEKPEAKTITIFEKEYVINDLSNKSKKIINHLDDIQKKLNSNSFIKEQLEVGKESFLNMLKESLGKGA